MPGGLRVGLDCCSLLPLSATQCASRYRSQQAGSRKAAAGCAQSKVSPLPYADVGRFFPILHFGRIRKSNGPYKRGPAEF